MPLLHHYSRIMADASPLADMNNTAGRPGGACNAAAFLKVRPQTDKRMWSKRLLGHTHRWPIVLAVVTKEEFVFLQDTSEVQDSLRRDDTYTDRWTNMCGQNARLTMVTEEEFVFL